MSYNLNNPVVIDFGCGEGALLNAVFDCYEGVKLFGVDFLENVSAVNFKYIQQDLEEINCSQFGDEDFFDYGYLVHVLEHIKDPRQLLISIKSMMHNNSYLYIEVPAVELLGDVDVFGVEVIHPQHIHNFNLSNLESMLRVLGFDVLKKSMDILEGINRLKFIVKPKVLNTDAIIVKGYLQKKKNKYLEVAKNIANKCLYEKGQVVIWGVGGDLEKIIKSDYELVNKIKNQTIVLVDKFLHGKIWLGVIINSPDIINEFNDSCIIIPSSALFHIRNSIKLDVNLHYGAHGLFDPYE